MLELLLRRALALAVLSIAAAVIVTILPGSALAAGGTFGVGIPTESVQAALSQLERGLNSYRESLQVSA